PWPAPLKGKKIAVFLDNEFQIDEAYYTPLRLKEAGAEVKIVSHYSPTVYRETFLVKTDISPKEALKTVWDGVFIVGGFCPMEMREDPDVIKIVQDTNKRGALVAPICHGVTVAVTADILRGKNVTGNIPRHKEFTNAGAIWHEVAPQIDGNLITAIGPSDNGPMLDAIIHWFNGGEAAAKAHMNEQYLKGKKVAIVFDQRFEYTQVKYPRDRLAHNGADITMVAAAAGDYREYRNVGNVKAEIGAQDASNERFDAIILVSGWAADTYRRNADVRTFINKNLRNGTMIASINWGHTAFIDGDTVKGYSFACTPGMANDIKNAGGTPVLKSINVDRNLITCARDEDMPELMRYVTGYLAGKK
ncbi:MAG: DJ-1/PfpI family protein, partial [Candidatus Latescibacterota bacterium]